MRTLPDDEWETNLRLLRHSYKYGCGLVDAYVVAYVIQDVVELGQRDHAFERIIRLISAREDCCGNWVESTSMEFGSHDFCDRKR